MQEKILQINEDVEDEISFLTDQNIPPSTISQTLGVSLDIVDRARDLRMNHRGLGRIRSART